MDQSMTPYQAGLGAFIDMSKEHFVGKAALLDADRRTLLYGLKSRTAAPALNDRILDGGVAVGRCTAGAVSPHLGCGIGYVRFDAPANWSGRTLTLEAADGAVHDCEIIELPFYDKDKRIPRGIDKAIP